jgi:NAD dependent epimerase/dehydratase family enzyme
MKLLVIGGTVFVGRHIVEAALSRGHEVTLFNRGEHNPDLFPEVSKIRGDRALSLEGLHGLRWDVVIDTCGPSMPMPRLTYKYVSPILCSPCSYFLPKVDTVISAPQNDIVYCDLFPGKSRAEFIMKTSSELT